MKNLTRERLRQKLKQSNKEKLSDNLAELKKLTGNITSFNSSQLVSIDNIVSFFTRLEDDSIINSYCKDLLSYLKNYDIQLIATLSSNRVNRDISLKLQNLETLYAKIYPNIQSYSSEEYNKYFYDVNNLGGFALLNILCRQNSENTTKIDQDNFCFLLFQKAREIYSFPEDQGQFTKLLQYYGINLSKDESNKLIITYKNQQSIISNIYSIATDILNLWKAGEKQKAENTFRFIKAQGIDINCSEISKNILFGIISLTKNTKDLPIDLLETLINLGADPNILIVDPKNNVINLLTFAISITNLELVNFLLDKGLLPLFDVDPISGCPEMLVTRDIQTYINDKSDILGYINYISKLIDASLINRLSKIYASRLEEDKEHETNTNTITIEESVPIVHNVYINTEFKKKKKKRPTKKNSVVKNSNVDEQVKNSPEDSKLNDDSKIKEVTKNDVPDNEENLRPNNEVVENTKVSITKKENKDKDIRAYIAFKDNSSRNNDLPEEERLKHEFDTALLKGDIGKTNKLLEENPHLYSYSLASLIKQNTPESLAGEVLAYDPKLLNKYFQLKKEQNNKKAVIETKNTDFVAENVYKVQSSFGGRILFKIADEISDKISSYDINKLSNLSIIPASSERKNGIKFYQQKGIYKLKLGAYNESAYARKIIVNEVNDILIIFDKWEDHNWLNRQTNCKIQIDKVTDSEFQNFMISSSDIDNLEGVSYHNPDCILPKYYYEEEKEQDFTPLLGEE